MGLSPRLFELVPRVKQLDRVITKLRAQRTIKNRGCDQKQTGARRRGHKRDFDRVGPMCLRMETRNLFVNTFAFSNNRWFVLFLHAARASKRRVATSPRKIFRENLSVFEGVHVTMAVRIPIFEFFF